MLSLGCYPDVSLKDARDKRDDARKLVAAKVDPSAQRQKQKGSRANTFRVIGAEFMALQKERLTSGTWARDSDMLERTLYPWIGDKPIREIEAPDLLAALKRIEADGHIESAHRARGLAGRVFRYAIAAGMVRATSRRICAEPCRNIPSPATRRSRSRMKSRA